MENIHSHSSGGVGEVAGVPVGVPALHHAVLDDQLHAGLAGVVDEGGEHLLRVAEVVGNSERPGSRPTKVPTVGQPRRTAASMQRCKCSWWAARSAGSGSRLLS